MRTLRDVATFLVLGLLGATPGLLAQETGRVVGRVYEQESGRPVSAAEVRLDDGGAAVTGGDGSFELTAVPAGNQQISISALGYEERRLEFLVQTNQIVEVRVPLTTEPLDLDPIEVSIRNRWLDVNGFYKRRDVIPGTYMTRSVIEEKSQRDFTDLFRGIPGVRIEMGERGNQVLKLRRGYGSSGQFPMFQVYIDGLRTDALGYNGLSPSAIEAIEVFKGANVPVEYGGRGVILVWTRGS